MAAQTTSLSSQLKALVTPATSQFAQKKGRASFLYTYIEAAGIECDTHYAHCLSGLDTLERSYPELNLSEFRLSLFSESSKSFERGLRSKEENEILDSVIESFLLQVITPHFLQDSCHKVLEYLVYKYHINEYNTDALIMSVLPYHETNLFPKLLQTIPEMKSSTNKWKTILHSCQRRGVHLPKASLLQACRSNSWLLDHIKETARNIGKKYHRSNVFITFSASVFIGVLSLTNSYPLNSKESSNNENILMSVLNYVEVGLKSQSQHFVIASYSVAAMMVCKHQLDDVIVATLLTKICRLFEKYSFRNDVQEHFVLLLAIIVDNQEVKEVPSEALDTILSSGMEVLNERPQFIAKVMEALVSKGFDKSIEKLYELSLAHPEAVKYIRGIPKSLFKLPESSEGRLKTFLFLLKLVLYEHDIVKKLKKMTNDASLAVEAIDSLTLVDNGIGLTQRLPFDVKTDAWRSVMIVLEVFSQTKNDFTNPDKLIKSCVQLLGESLVFHEEADCEYFRILLVRTVFRSLDSSISGTDFSYEVLQRIMESLRYFRKKESMHETLQVIEKILEMEGQVKRKDNRLLENLMLLFGFSFGSGSHIFDDDQGIMDLFNNLLRTVIPSYSMKESDQKLLLDTVLHSLYDVLPVRRIHLVYAVLKELNKKSDWTPFAVLSLLHNSVVGSVKEVQDFNEKFAAQLLIKIYSEKGGKIVLDILTDMSCLLFPPFLTQNNNKEPTVRSKVAETKDDTETTTIQTRRMTRSALRKTAENPTIPDTSSSNSVSLVKSTAQEITVTGESMRKASEVKRVSVSKTLGNSWYQKLRDNMMSSVSLDRDLLNHGIFSIMSRVMTDPVFDSSLLDTEIIETRRHMSPQDEENETTTVIGNQEGDNCGKSVVKPRSKLVTLLHESLKQFMDASNNITSTPESGSKDRIQRKRLNIQRLIRLLGQDTSSSSHETLYKRTREGKTS
jgi:hypothetical protein